MTRISRRTLMGSLVALSLFGGAGTALAADKILASVPGLSFPFFVHMMNAFKAEIGKPMKLLRAMARSRHPSRRRMLKPRSRKA